jgi:hypothetical protein
MRLVDHPSTRGNEPNLPRGGEKGKIEKCILESTFYCGDFLQERIF